MNELELVFTQLKPLLMQYQPPLQSKRDEAGYFDLWSFKDLVIAGRQRKEVFFAGLIIQKSYVGFYYMPVYAEPEIKALIEPDLLKLLKGKSCFHFRKLTPPLLEAVRSALAKGFALYTKNGWV